MDDRTDLTIVGGSFAGLVCAHRAAERGLRVAVVERKPDVGARVHTTGIAVREAAEELPLPPELTRTIRGVRLYTPRGRTVDLSSPGYYFLATDTPALLRWLARRAGDAGASVHTACTFRTARREANGWLIEEPAHPTRYLIGADGPRSAVAAALGLGRIGRCLVGVEAELAGVAGVDPERLHCFVDSRLAPGYIAWVVPGVGVTQVGLACRQGRKPSLARFMERLGGLFDFSAAHVVGRRSGLIPVGGTVRPVWAPGALLVGDAAGLVSPLTAGGIHPAFRFGRMAADAVADHLLDGGAEPGPQVAAHYPGYRWKALLRRLLDLDPPNALYDALFALPPMQAFARLVYFHHKGFASRGAWRDLFRRG